MKTTPSTSRFGDARWIWPATLGRAINQYVEFQQIFLCREVPDRRAVLRIAADTVYAIWLNDECVDTGRLPDVPPERGYDTLQVGAALKKGRNTLVVGLYVQGADSFQHLPGQPGLLFALQGKGVSVVSGAHTTWRASASYSSGGTVPRITGQLGFAFAYDATRREGKWRRISVKDLGEHATEMVLRPRPIPPSDVLPRIATQVVAQGLLGPSGSVDPSQAMQNDGMAARTFREMFGGDASPLLPSDPGLKFAHAQGDDDGFYVIIDLGREETGFVSLDLNTDAGVTVDIGHGEHLADLRVRAFVGRRNFASRLICRNGRQVFTHWYKRMAGRYIQLNIRGVRSRFILHYAGLFPSLYPVTERGRFAASDRRMNDIFQTATRTLRLCMHEHYEDCPWREQALYANDGRNQALAGYYALDTGKFAAASLDLLGRGLKPDGWLEMCMPAAIDITIPSFTFAWILAVADNWMYRADRPFARRAMPVVRTILMAREGEMREGLLPCPPGQRYWQFYDWVKGLDGNGRIKPGEIRFDAPLNMAYCLALRAGALIARECGSRSDADRWAGLADTLSGTIHKKFWDASAAAYHTFSGDSAVVHFCELVQSLALLSGTVRNEKTRASLRAQLTAPSAWVETSLSQSLYKYEALLGGGAANQQAAIDAMNDAWYAMLRQGATSFWETRHGEADFAGAGSLCHGWSAIPAYFYGAYVLGVRPVEPGFAAFTIHPVRSSLQEARGTVPTPYGDIEVAWERGGAACRCQVIYPAGCHLVRAPGRSVIVTAVVRKPGSRGDR